jgi:hypothetical protein
VRRRFLGMADDDHLFSGHPIFQLHSQREMVLAPRSSYFTIWQQGTNPQQDRDEKGAKVAQAISFKASEGADFFPLDFDTVSRPHNQPNAR